MSTTNGSSHIHSTRPKITLRAGLYAPVLTMFTPTEDLDLPTQRTHAVRLAKAGLVGLVAMGSNGEAVHLSRPERVSIISSMRSALDEAGFNDVPVIAGCTEQSTRETISLCEEAAQAGASYAIILPPCYYKPAMDAETIYQHFADVADESPIPIMMYNYPGAVAGVDMDSDLMIRIARHGNVAGAKFTCANTGKLTRVAAAMDAMSYKSQGSGFVAMGGLADMTIQTMVSGGSGIIAGTANVLPKLCVKVWDLCVEGKMEEAMEMTKILADADWAISKTGIPGTKAALREGFGYGGFPRRPLQRFEGTQAKKVAEDLMRAFKVESGL